MSVEEVEERRMLLYCGLMVHLSSTWQFVVVGVSFIAAGEWQHVWMYIDGV